VVAVSLELYSDEQLPSQGEGDELEGEGAYELPVEPS
jgi:hypothetical protein